MRQNTNSGRGRGSRDDGKARNGARKPKLDPSRGQKARRSRIGSNECRDAARSVFSTKPSEKNADGEYVDRGRRLQQVLAAAGFGSRRACEDLIVEGRVEVDGCVVTELGVRVFPNEQKIRVDGEALPKARPVYLALNKPKNTLCTNNDPSGRRRVVDFIPEEFGRLFPVGRLDQNSEGLILLTNDGALAERLTHPRFEVPKKYRVQVAGLVDFELVDALKRGVHIAEGVVQADDVVIKSRHKLSSVLEITLTEGKNREIRRMLARVGHKVMQLERVQVGSIKISGLAPGEFRKLTPQEVADLYRIAESRPDGNTLDVSKLPPSLRMRPIEVSAVQEREAEKEVAREKAAKQKEKNDQKKKFDPNFYNEVKTQLKRGYALNRDVEGDYSDSEQEWSDRRRAPKREFREEFRSKERADDRRRARREFDDEERVYGSRNFERKERRGRDSFNEGSAKKSRVRTDSAPRRAPSRDTRGSDSRSNGLGNVGRGKRSERTFGKGSKGKGGKGKSRRG